MPQHHLVGASHAADLGALRCGRHRAAGHWAGARRRAAGAADDAQLGRGPAPVAGQQPPAAAAIGGLREVCGPWFAKGPRFQGQFISGGGGHVAGHSGDNFTHSDFFPEFWDPGHTATFSPRFTL